MTDGGVTQVLEKHAQDDRGLIAILEEIQTKYSYLPEEALKMVAERTNRSLVDVYGVATFYRFFSLTPRGKHLVSVCMGTACHVRGAPAILKEFEHQLGIRAGQTTEDKEFTLETVNCLGACALGPVVVVDGDYFSNVRKRKVAQILDDTLRGGEAIRAEQDYHIFPVEVSCPRCNHALMDTSFAIDGYPCIRVTVSFGRKHGWVRLSSLYGSYQVFSEYEIPPDTIVNFFCPHCHAELKTSWNCPICGAPMVNMIVRGGGTVQICSRRGCRHHMLDLG
jgi:NADH-quinone oxidoreductase subunit E